MSDSHRHELIFDDLPFAIIIAEFPGGKVIDINRKALEFIGAVGEELSIGRFGEVIKCKNAETTPCGTSPKCDQCKFKNLWAKVIVDLFENKWTDTTIEFQDGSVRELRYMIKPTFGDIMVIIDEV